MTAERFSALFKESGSDQTKTKESLMENEERIKPRAFVSISMFLFIIILFVTAVIIQIAEAFVENAETVPIGLSFLLHSATAIHVLTGLIFAGLSVVHVIVNWNVLKNHFGKSQSRRSKEVVLAFLLALVPIAVGIVVGISFIL
jgi:predicted nucleic acid-binding Zn ribbon protein